MHRVFWSGLRLDVLGEELVTGMERRGASWREEAQYDMNFSFMAVIVPSLAWMLAVSQRRIHACSSLLRFSTLSNVAMNCRIVVAVMAQPFSDVTW